MTEPIAETRPAEDAAPVDETINNSVAEEAEAEAEAEADVEEDEAVVAEADLEVEEGDDIKSKKVTLADLSAKGTALYAHKKYEAAADIFAERVDMRVHELASVVDDVLDELGHRSAIWTLHWRLLGHRRTAR